MKSMKKILILVASILLLVASYQPVEAKRAVVSLAPESANPEPTIIFIPKTVKPTLDLTIKNEPEIIVEEESEEETQASIDYDNNLKIAEMQEQINELIKQINALQTLLVARG